MVKRIEYMFGGDEDKSCSSTIVQNWNFMG